MIKTKIAAIASDLEAKHNGGAVPVNLDAVVAGLGLNVRRNLLGDDVSGVIFRESDGGTVIAINKAEKLERQRFTLAHEIAHFVLHREKDLCLTSQKLFRRSGGNDFRETEANTFAAELLMPRSALERETAALSPDDILDSVPKLADKFQVSISAMTYRLANLQLLPVC